MPDTTLILTFLIVIRTASPIVTIISGLDHDTEVTFVQMSWRFFMKCLVETGGNKKNKERKKKTTATTTNQQKISNNKK